MAASRLQFEQKENIWLATTIIDEQNGLGTRRTRGWTESI
jgi:hypothetical protein